MKPAILILALLLAAGCAGTRIRPVEVEGRSDPAALVAALAEYNREGKPLRVLGEARPGGGPKIGFGARAVAGTAFRLDGIALPSTRVIFSAACGPEAGCEVYLPDEGRVYRDANGKAGGWLSMLVTGRVPLLGRPLYAGVSGDGLPVLVGGDDLGQWSKITFDREGRLPARAVYGEGDKPRFEVVLKDFFEDGGVVSPGEVLAGGENEGQEFVLRIERIEEAGELPIQAFRIRLPEGVRSIEADGSGAWKKLGMFWIPKN